MSERGLPATDGAHACPFVAFEDDRDERASVPDHRHRCYAEVRPAPRALAHQEAYCLSSAFPVCPTFQDWARRESARARDAAAASAASASALAGASARPGPSAASPEPTSPEAASTDPAEPAGLAAVAGSPAASGAIAGEAATGRGPEDDTGDAPQWDVEGGQRSGRNPPRDWSDPPAWLASRETEGGSLGAPPDLLSHRTEAGQGLAGSAADQLAGGPPPRPQRPATTVEVPRESRDPGAYDIDEPTGHPQPARRPRAYSQHLGGPTSGPDWERPPRYEAYPTIKTRMGMPAIPRLAVMAAAVAIAALAVFFLPALLGVGRDEQATASPTPSAAPSRSLEPTTPPAPTPIVYLIKKGDTLSKIAVANGITIEELLAANPSIKDPNKITEGQAITIPPPSAEVPNEFGGSPVPSSPPP